MKKLAQMAKGKGEPKGVTSTAKSLVTGEKCPWDEMPNISPLKKDKQAAHAKKKELMLPPEDKKKGPDAKARQVQGNVKPDDTYCNP